jgi:DNA invertase Pin-like site-specific DNA recombinase
MRTIALSQPTPVANPAIDTIGYIRVSTEDQATEQKTSLAVQRAEIAALASRLGRTLDDAAVYEDAGLSGTSAEGRPAFMALVRFCQAHSRSKRVAPGYVVVLNDSRFGRFDNPEESAYWRITLQKSGWIVRYAENDDTSDITTRTLMRAIGASTASAYSKQLSANTRRGMKAAAERGNWTRRAPFGYRRQAIGAGREPVVLDDHVRKADDQVTRLVPGPADEVATVRWMFTSYASGEHTLGSLARELQHRAPVRKWGVTVVQAVLKNDVYIGYVTWGKRPNGTMLRKQLNVQPKSQWVITRDAHPALVTEDLFNRVQERMRLNYRSRRMTHGGYPLSGLVTCAQCGHAYVGGGGNRGSAADPDRYRFYRDSGGADNRHVCPGRLGTASRRWLEPTVIDAVADVLERPKVRAAIESAVDEAIERARSKAPDDRRRTEIRRVALQSELDRVVDAVARGVLPDDVARGKVEALRRELGDVGAQAERSRFDARAVDQLEDARTTIRALTTDIRARLNEAKGERLKELLRPWLANAVVDKVKRTLALTIRCVPAGFSLCASFNSPAQG